MSRVAAMYTYPWDLADEGTVAAVERIRDLAGQNEVLLAASYHIATYFLPHNPRRKLYYGEDGMVLFLPERHRYEKGRIQPRVSELVTGPRYFEEQVRAAREAGLRCGAWMVYAYNHCLARTYPDCARHDALGNLYPSQLCPSQPEVRRYFETLMREVLERFQPETVHLESLSFLPFEYGFLNPKLFMEITPRDRFLLGLCFCDGCLDAADGLDAARLKGAVASHLARSLPREPAEEDRATVSAEWLDTAFEGRLAEYLAARVETATGLYEEIADLCRAHSARPQDLFARPGSEWVSGLDPVRRTAACSRLCIPPDQAPDLPRLKDEWPGKQFLVSLEPADTGPELPQWCRDAAALGADGFTFYNYGLLREERLARIGEARTAWS